MKRVLLLSFACCILAITGCDNEEIKEPGGFETLTVPGVSEWTPEQYTFNRYYTLIETFGEAEFRPKIMVKAPDGADITVFWQIKGQALPNVELYRNWDASIQLWQYEFIPEMQEALTFGETAKVTVTFDGKTYIREVTVQENKITREIFWVNFGMTKEEVQNNIPSFSEYGPAIFIGPSLHNVGNTLFRFQDGKLIEIAEYGSMTLNTETLEVTGRLCDLCYSLGLTEKIEAIKNEDSYELLKEYVWNNGEIEFTLRKIDYAPPPSLITYSSANKSYYNGIVYRKL